MRNERIVATCGCICEVSAEYNWADESICDVEVDILELVCDYHRGKQNENKIRVCPACHALLEENSVYCDVCGTDTPK